MSNCSDQNSKTFQPPKVEAVLLSEHPCCDCCNRTYLEATADEIFYRIPEYQDLVCCSGCLPVMLG